MHPARVALTALAAATGAALVATLVVGYDPLLWKLVLVAVALALPAALCASRQPHNPVGWLLLAVALGFAVMGLAARLDDAGRAGPWSTWVTERAGAVVVPLMLVALLLLPHGRLPSPAWRPVVAVVVAAQVLVVAAWSLVAAADGAEANPVGVLPAAWSGTVDSIGDWVLQLPLLLVVAAAVVRLPRREERTRLAPVLGGAGTFAVLSAGGRVVWPAGADVLDVLGAAALGAGLTVTLLRWEPDPTPVPADAPRLEQGDHASLDRLAALSEREREVLALVAEGLTNRQIAERLFISPVTARNHVSRILTKLGLENRTQAAALVAREGPRPRP